MSKATAARKLASAAAYGGGGLSVLGAALYGVLKTEAAIARRTIGPAESDPADASGLYGAWRPGVPIRLAVLGDSAAAGYGMSDPDQTPGAILAAGLAAISGRPVRLSVHAVVGAQTRQLDAQIDRALRHHPEVAVIVVGANDVTHARPPKESLSALGAAVTRLREAGAHVVVGTAPDLGTVRPIAQPLRWVARTWSRRLAAGQTIATVEAGGRSVSLGVLLGPEFEAAPAEYFGADNFHPSAAGYASVAAAMLPSVAAALGEGAEAAEPPAPERGDAVLPVWRAAAEATRDSGVETAPVEDRRVPGPLGRLANLRHRRRHVLPEVDRTAEGDWPARSAGEQTDAGDRANHRDHPAKHAPDSAADSTRDAPDSDAAVRPRNTP